MILIMREVILADEYDLKVAEQLGEIRATLKAIEHRLAIISGYDGRIALLELQFVGYRAQVAGMALGISCVSTLIGWAFLNWNRLMRLFA